MMQKEWAMFGPPSAARSKDTYASGLWKETLGQVRLTFQLSAYESQCTQQKCQRPNGSTIVDYNVAQVNHTNIIHTKDIYD